MAFTGIGKTFLVFIVPLTVLFSCSPSNTKILSSPPKIGINKNSKLLIGNISNVEEIESASLIEWATSEFKLKCPAVNLPNYWKTDYQARQMGIVLPELSEVDSAALHVLNSKLGINLLLVSHLDKLLGNYDNEKNNTNYQRREAIVSLRLIDLTNREVIWHCTTRVYANPIKANGKTQSYSVNILSTEYALKRAFKASVKELINAISIIKQNE